MGFPCDSAGKESSCDAGDLGSIPGLGRSPGEGKDYPLQYSGLENSMDCIVYGVAKSWRQLSNSTTMYLYSHIFSIHHIYIYKTTESESHSVVSNSLQPHVPYSPWNSLGQSTGVGSLSLLQGIFPTQGWNPGLPHCRQILYQLSHKGSPCRKQCRRPGFNLWVGKIPWKREWLPTPVFLPEEVHGFAHFIPGCYFLPKA